MADDNGGEWLTWVEAADRLGIKPDSVKRRARSRHWPRKMGNDGMARVLIPSGRLEAIPTDSREEGREEGREVILPPSSPDTSMLERAIRAEAKAETAEKILDEIRADRDHWREIANNLSNREPVRIGILDRLFNRWR